MKSANRGENLTLVKQIELPPLADVLFYLLIYADLLSADPAKSMHRLCTLSSIFKFKYRLSSSIADYI